VDPAGGPSVDFLVLGPVSAVREGEVLPLGGPRQRALLALLLLQPGRVISTDRLIDEIWAGEPPRGAERTLRSYVSRLRAALGDTPRITGTAAGYALAVVPDQIDAGRFERLVLEAEAALGRRKHGRARELVSEALALWRGQPYAELAADGALRVEAERLQELHLRASELRLEAMLAHGEATSLIDELETLVREHPFRERLWQFLMLALYRADRQADALAAYARARKQLVGNLGLDPGEDLQRLQQQILRHEVPPASPPGARHNLPAPLTGFIGRDAELAELARAVTDHRLVTLTGIGGVGKTRLALEAARRQVSAFSDGVVFVDLSALVDEALVAGQVSGAMDVREQPGAMPTDALVAHLRDRELLLVLDNCEHLVGACAGLADAILTRCDRVRILATSRELLGVPGEIDVAVQPLGLPAADASAEVVRATDSVGLFISRAREARQSLVDDDAAARRAAEICRDLDGLPLAIELAAARARTLSLDEIAQRVRERFKFLVSWRRLAAARHRTLRGAIDWSYDLLSPAEQDLLVGLSVFAGGCTLEAAAAICLDGDEDATLGLLDRLAASSLVNPVHGASETRYRLLETVRQYAAERLEARGDADVVRRRHATHYRSMLDAAWAPIRLDKTAAWTERLTAELDNLRVALGWARDTGDADELLRLAEGLWYFWWVHGDLAEGREWLALALERATGADPVLHSRALNGAARLAWAATDFEAGIQLATQAWAALPKDAGALDKGIVLQTLGVIATAREDRPAARDWLEQARRQFESLRADDPWRRDRLAGVIVVLGSIDFFDGDYAGATSRYREALADCVARDDRDGIALCELYLGHVALLEGRLGEAAALLRSALRHYGALGWLQYATECLELIAYGAQDSGRPEEAVRLVGAADTLRDRTGSRAALQLARHRDRRLPQLRATLGEAAYASVIAAGRALADRDAFAEADRIATEIA
jgi:predicted ATPase/DNA-binding SARP family transcriptional activator